MPTCEDVVQLGLCNLPTEAGVRARQFCPSSCGCKAPSSNLVLHLLPDGCPSSCDESAEYTAGLATLAERCEDFSHVDGPFKEFLDALTALSTTWPESVKFLGDNTLPAIRALGCPALAPLRAQTGYDFCIENGTPFPTKAFAYFCPLSCGCAREAACPFRCAGSLS